MFLKKMAGETILFYFSLRGLFFSTFIKEGWKYLVCTLSPVWMDGFESNLLRFMTGRWFGDLDFIRSERVFTNCLVSIVCIKSPECTDWYVKLAHIFYWWLQKNWFLMTLTSFSRSHEVKNEFSGAPYLLNGWIWAKLPQMQHNWLYFDNLDLIFKLTDQKCWKNPCLYHIPWSDWLNVNQTVKDWYISGWCKRTGWGSNDLFQGIL